MFLFSNMSVLGSKLYYTFRETHAQKASMLLCVSPVSEPRHMKNYYSQHPQYTSLQVTMFVNSRSLLVKDYIIIFLQQHWMLLLFSKGEVMKMLRKSSRVQFSLHTLQVVKKQLYVLMKKNFIFFLLAFNCISIKIYLDLAGFPKGKF